MENIKVIKSNRKTLSLEIKHDGSVVVRAPLYAGTEQIESFVLGHKAWLEKHLAENERARRECSAFPPLSDDDINAIKTRAKQYIPVRVEYWADIIGVKYSSVTIRTQRTRWGSCSSKGNLNFNCLLMLTDTEIIDYVVIHELCHIKEMNHSKRFWALVGSVMPDYKAVQSRLKSTEGQIFSRLEKN